MKTKIYSTLLLSFFSLCVFANTSKYRLSLRADPATTIVIGWDQTSGSNPVVHYGTTDQGTNYNAYSNSKAPDRTVSYRGMNNHFARLTGLQPNTYYYFVIRDSQGTSQRMYFKTAPNNANERLSFIAGGDSRNNRTPRQNANKLVAKLKPTAVLFGGDMTDNDTNSQWIEWFEDWQFTKSGDGRMYPIVATRGNHEGSNNVIYNLFDVPSSNVYYALNFGGNLVRSYTLNTEMSISGSQTSWLSNDLNGAGSNVTWRLAQYHKPMRPHVASKSEGNNQYNYWSGLFYDHKVQLVIECDAHTVKTTWPLRPSTGSGSDEGFIRDDANGTVYAGEGCWGAPTRSNDDNKNWTRNSGSFNQFKWIFVDQSKIEVRTIKVDNASSVGEVSNGNPFQIPSNLDVWNPSNGSVVTINQSTGGGGSNPTPGIIDKRIASSMDDVEQNANGSIYTNSSDLELVADGSKGNQTVGLRFTNIDIPQGATITNAYIQFTTDETNSGTTNLTIKGDDSNSAASFTTAINNVSGRAKTSASASWNPAAWNSVGQAGSAQRTPELKSIVQEIINRSGWSSGNNMAFIITGTGERTAEAYDGVPSQAPLLHIEFDESGSGGGNSPVTETLTKAIATGNDDVEQRPDGTMYFDSSDLELINDSHTGGNQVVGLRFTSINIPQGATIDNAYIQFTVDETKNSNGSKSIYGEDSNSSGAFSSSSNDVSNRTKTSASVSWNPPSWNSIGAAGTDQRTPNLKSIVQEIVDRSGWNTGNNISFIIDGSGTRTAESYDGSASQAPKLVVTYTYTSGARTATSEVKETLENEVISSVTIFPNPAKADLHIRYSADWQGGNFLIYSLNGSVIREGILNEETLLTIKDHELTKGVYLFKLINGDKVHIQKVIKD